MKLEKFKIKNFRGYREEVCIDFNDITVLIGKNDIGKSTILEALDIFFNDNKGVVKIDKSDLNTNAKEAGDDDIVLTACFSNLPEKVIIDATVETSLAEEYMLNEDKQLEVVKHYKEGGSARVYIRALSPSSKECKDLIIRKNSELQRILKSNAIECENRTINHIMRNAIWRYYGNTLDMKEQEIDISKEDAKKIWEKLSQYMPIYSLFQSDRKNSDSDDEVQDPLREAVKQIISDKEIQKQLCSIAETVKDKLYTVANATLDKLTEMDESVAASLTPIIPAPDKLKWADVFKSVSITGDNSIPINKRGSGVRRLILLNFFRAQAEQNARESASTNIIYAIEEPETSQHNNNQRILAHSFTKLANRGDAQILLTSHSPILVKELDYNDLRIIDRIDNKKIVKKVDKALLPDSSLNEANYLAYDEASVDYHNELYGYMTQIAEEDNESLSPDKRADLLAALGKKYNKDLPLKYHQGYIGYKTYYRTKRNGEVGFELILTTIYIRHQIHHPENTYNPHYTADELRESIKAMRAYLEDRKINRQES